ncbi:MAG: hypothetical protein AAF960_28065 [Bacteroidota bacterium]
MKLKTSNIDSVYSWDIGDFIPAAVLGAGIGLVSNGLSNIANGNNFFAGAGKAALFGAIGGAASFGIGQIANGITNGLGQAAFQMGAHGALGGGLSVAQGGSFGSGFLSGAISSGLSSGAGALGVKNGGMIAVGALGGGIGSAVGGGSFWKGVGQGLISSGLNHAAHSGAFGESYAMSLLTGEARHIFGPDAESMTLNNDIVMAVGTDQNHGALKILRGKDKGIYPYSEGTFSVGFDVSLGVEYSRFYYSGKLKNFGLKTFQGYFGQASIAATLGIDYGGTLSVGFDFDNNEFTYGIGYGFGVGVPFPGPLTGNFGIGASSPWHQAFSPAYHRNKRLTK